MSGLEFNKVIAAILVASLVAMLTGSVANILYKPHLTTKRGYQVSIIGHTNDQNSANAIAETKIDIKELMNRANADAGKGLIKKCTVCHSLDKGGVHKIGPNLWNVAGADKAKAPGYKFSSSMVSTAGKWDDESLYHFLRKPSKFIPGTKMSFIGISDPQDIADIILYLKTIVHD